MVHHYAILYISLLTIGLCFRSEVAVGSSGQALVGMLEFEEDTEKDGGRANGTHQGDGAAIVAADAGIAEMPGEPPTDGAGLDASTPAMAAVQASSASAQLPIAHSLSGGRHAARYIAAVARLSLSDQVSAGAVTEVAREVPQRPMADVAFSSAETAEKLLGNFVGHSVNTSVGVDLDKKENTPGAVPRMALEAAPALEVDADTGSSTAGSSITAAAAQPSAERWRRSMASLLEGRVAVLASKAVAQLVARSGSPPGGWIKCVVAACLVALMIICASPCAAALCPARAPKPERPRRRPLPKSVVVGKRGLTRQEKLGDILADVASSGSESEDISGSKLSASLTKDLSAIVASISSQPAEEKKRPSEDLERSRRREAKVVVTEVSRIAKQLQTTALKYPKSGKSGFIFDSSPQKRFLLVLPQPTGESSKKRSDGSSQEPTHELLLWQSGRLAWWETEASYQQKVKPKGSIPLARIHDVQQGDTSESVVIQHQDRESRCSLELVFASNDASKAWTTRFRELLVKLNSDIR